MEPDDIINAAMTGAGQMIGGKEIFILEGQVERNEFRILPVDKALGNNITAFAYSIPTGFIFLGMYTTRQAAEETIETIRTLIRDENGKTLL